jgi:hypothetical protein
LGQKDVSEMDENWVKTAKSGQGAGLTGYWAGPSGVTPGLGPVRLPPDLGSGFDLICEIGISVRELMQ